jgi:hypothetical protein
MKLITILLLSTSICCCLTDDANCQLKYGFKGGLNLAKGKFDEGTTAYTLKFHLGFLANFSLGKKFYLQPELIYSQKGWRIPENTTNNYTSITLSYLNLPIFIGYRLNKSASLFAGSEVGIKLSGKRNPEGSWKDPYEDFDSGILVGANYTIASKIGIDLRYVHGFRGLIKRDYTDINRIINTGQLHEGSNRVLQLGIFYFIN